MGKKLPPTVTFTDKALPSICIKTFLPVLFISLEVLTLVYYLLTATDNVNKLQHPSTHPWQVIGGCGAGGNGYADALTAPFWLDDLSANYRISVQSNFSYRVSQSYASTYVITRCTGFPTQRVLVGLSVPLVRNSGYFQALSNVHATSGNTGGIGDISLDAGYILFPETPLLLRAYVQFPTGNYSIARGSDNSQVNLPVAMQNGTGVYSLTLSARYQCKVFDNSLVNVYAACLLPFQMRLFSGKNEFLDERLAAYAIDRSNSRFYYRFKPYGENDLGRFLPPELNIGGQYAIPAGQFFKHSIAAQVNFPFGVQWVPDDKYSTYYPHPDYNHKAWRSTWRYIPEVHFGEYTCMGFLALELNDKTNMGWDNAFDDRPYSKSDGPDWGSFIQQWAIGIGVRYSFVGF